MRKEKIATKTADELHGDELVALLDAMDAELGKPNKAAVTWAKRVLERRSRNRPRV